MNGLTKGFVCLVSTILILSGCSIDEPVLPKWVVPIVVPIGKEKIILHEELAQDSTIVSVGDTLSIQFEDDFNPKSISQEDLTLSGEHSATSFSLENFQIDSFKEMDTKRIAISELLPVLVTLVGQSYTIPETTLTASPTVVTSDEFITIQIESGTLKLSLYNNLPFSIGSNSTSPEGIRIKIFDDSTATLITEIIISDEIPPGEIGRGSAPLVNQSDYMGSHIRLDYQLPISRQTTFFITNDLLNTAGFNFKVGLSDLSIKEIIGKVASQQFSHHWELDFSQQDQIVRAQLAAGLVQLQLFNQIALGVTVRLRLVDIKNGSGQVYQEEINMQPNSTINHEIDLKNFFIESSTSPGEAIEGLAVNFEAITHETQNFVHVKKSDLIQANVTTTEFKFSEIEGFLAPDTLMIDSFQENNIIDYHGIDYGFKFHSAQLQLAIQNQIDIDNLALNLDITGYHKNESGAITDSATITVQELVKPSQQDTIVLEGEDVVNFLNILPTDMKGAGYVVYSGRAHLSVGDQIGGSYSFTTPLKFEIINPSSIEIDPDTLTENDIDEDLQDAIGDDIQFARLHADVENFSPVGGTIEIFVTNDLSKGNIYDETLDLNPETTFIKTITVQGAAVSNITGFVKQAVETQVDFELSTVELRIFKEPPLLIGYKVLLNETNGPVVIKRSDYIEMSGKVEVQLLVKDGE